MPYGRVPANGQIAHTEEPVRSVQGNRILYVNKVGSDGWVLARAEESGALLPLHKFVKVSVSHVKHGRTFFKALEGLAKGPMLSMADANFREYIGPRSPVSRAVDIVVTYGSYVPDWHSAARNQTLAQQMAMLEVEGIKAAVAMNSIWGAGYSPLPAGQYTVLLPDVPHGKDMTRYYRNVEPALKFDQVWFPIRYGNNSRYVHVGNVSEGCITVVDLARWVDIHDALVGHRSGDGVTVARLTVQGTPERAR